MKTKAIKILGLIMLLSMAIPAVYARGPTGPSGKSNVAHLYLVEKDPSNWTIIEDGAWGKMMFKNGSSFNFVFNGHGLQTNTNYTLIYYADPWPGINGTDIGMGTSNIDGDLHLMGSPDIGDIPVDTDINFPDGGKIWLVLSDDYDSDADEMVGWNPTEYLFEFDLIGYDSS
jgi:hypothetical protein